MKRLTTEIFIEKAISVHGIKFDYSCANYINNNTKIIIICPIHGEFKQTPNDHLKGRGCASCFGNKKFSLDKFIEISNTIHNNKYNYSKSYYINNDTNIDIICNEHGEFAQLPSIHLTGSGCPKCGVKSSYDKRKKNRNNVINDFNIIHNNKYDYSLINYTNAHCKLTIICKKHGEFIQRASAHLLGQGCPKCGFSISKAERQWLDKLEVSEKFRQKTITINKKRYRVDAYDPVSNTIYEFYGDYWHGNPKVYNSLDINKHNKKLFGDLYKLTMDRENDYKNNGYNIISIWENDYKFIII